MLVSIQVNKTAVVNTIPNLDDPPVEFSALDWKKVDQVIHVLQIFKDATLKLSCHDASISMGIPIITSIIEDLGDETAQDVGVLGMKRELKKAMETRFAGMDYYFQLESFHLTNSRFARSKVGVFGRAHCMWSNF